MATNIMHALEMTAMDLESARERLLLAVTRVSDRCDWVKRIMASGGTLNSSGELQGAALDMDLAVKEVRMMETQLDMIRRIRDDVIPGVFDLREIEAIGVRHPTEIPVEGQPPKPRHYTVDASQMGFAPDEYPDTFEVIILGDTREFSRMDDSTDGVQFYTDPGHTIEIEIHQD